MAVDPRDFLLNTDYPFDKVILCRQGEFTSSVDIQHGLSFVPLPFGVWSTDEDFNSVNTLGSSDPVDEPGYTPALSVNCSADSNKITLTAAGNAGNVKIYYRLYAFEPSDSRAHVPATSSNAKQFIFNTDYNYCKLFKDGEFSQNGEEFVHGLGYIPQVMAWVSYGGSVFPLPGASDFTNMRLSVNDSKIIAGDMFLDTKIYWRIYYDEA